MGKIEKENLKEYYSHILISIQRLPNHSDKGQCTLWYNLVMDGGWWKSK